MDGNPESYALGYVFAGGSCGEDSERWYGFPSGAGTTPKVLKIASAVSLKTTEIPGPSAGVQYSLDSGIHWTLVYLQEGSSRTQTTDSITLPNTQDITQVRVWADVQGPDPEATGSYVRQYIYDIWIEEGTP